MGDDQVGASLQRFDDLYPQESGESALQQLQVQLSNALPFDLEELELAEYRNLNPKWHDWNTVKTVCAHLATMIFDRVSEMRRDMTVNSMYRQPPLTKPTYDCLTLRAVKV